MKSADEQIEVNKTQISEKEWLDLKGEIAVCKRENTAMREIMEEMEKDERQLVMSIGECKHEMRMTILIIVLAPIIGEALVTLIKIFAISL